MPTRPTGNHRGLPLHYRIYYLKCIIREKQVLCLTSKGETGKVEGDRPVAPALSPLIPATLHHFNAMGKAVDITGKTRTKATKATSSKTKGTMPLKTVPIGISGTSPWIT